ncbi:hypothetical protein BFJ63_vAg16467 [Fusarium oxysporum f. sp. narcissi]|nr:hypothetical protein HZS61_011343 [Fusarium oxysporum f. sp. conglutinans]KAH7471197.1 hypothetical protein FOMA001_g13661 [Fusarium oxysporum f. sp. matthiolae]KAJ4014792.1 hypothetical protein NW758_015135 [Fusarium oxysporum]RYC80646.1 hypothetical protein BFJ63_vAg16467 [Fusarium oxysporum f. sp. narcissi]KAJ4069037.1 hypothetical protein NW761_015178 [Fusarium oxysporum]
MHLAIGVTTIQSDLIKGIKGTAAKVEPHVAKAIIQGIADLTDMAPSHHFAEQALNILRYLAQKWNIEVDKSADKLAAEEYNRLILPHIGCLNFFAPNVRDGDMMCQWVEGEPIIIPEESSATQNTGSSMENPLFWPFRMQGRPILPDGGELEHAGFSVL